ncbi:hypothetical protein AAFF_G00177060 [Aldrovandia affinis]|uniref:Uncharacterized protein n=1 Tax=Aldrovandia affinis TaxID=143900 RepID=A0AAD7W702_9TELE|nr:hypothetical protein AAFF_G00177060 [Aldrovandia affinis]
MQCKNEDAGFFPAELKVEAKRLVCRIMEEAGAELISLGPDGARSSPTLSEVARDIGSMFTDYLQSAITADGADVRMPDPDTTIYMEDSEEEGACVGVRLWGFSELLIRQVTQLILDSRKCSSIPQTDLEVAKDYHVELLYKFVEQVVMNLLENITYLTKEAELRKEMVVNVPCGLPTLEEELGGESSYESIPRCPSAQPVSEDFLHDKAAECQDTKSILQQATLASDQTEERVQPKCEQKSSKSSFRLTRLFKNSVAPLILEDSMDGSTSLSGIKKPKTFHSRVTAALSGLLCFSCNTDINE